MLKYQGKRVLVMGMARSGLSSVQLLMDAGADLTVYDRKSPQELAEHMGSIPNRTRLITGEGVEIARGDFDLVVTSPGIPLDNPMMMTIQEAGIPIISEIELAFKFKPAELSLLAITGTNGKTTTTSLVAEIINSAGIPSVAAGNIGLPLSAAVQAEKEGIVSVECSSFQLEAIQEFHPLVSAIINITPDHLDRHKTMENYARIKSRIFMNQTLGEYTILNGDDPLIRQMTPPCKVCYFSFRTTLEQGVWIENEDIMVRLDESPPQRVCRVSEVRLRGRHNLENVLCAVGLTRAAGIEPFLIRETLIRFEGVKHRLEDIRTVNGVLYVNDSKGTNPESTIKAMESFSDPIILIAGGSHKNSDFSEMAKVIARRVKVLVLLGETRSIIREAAEKVGFRDITEASSLEEAVALAKERADAGDVVLLSPACASYDMFRDYEERGEYFRKIVWSLGEDRI
ncbi:MAG: UDP-N-acetylmuramoyl-L-alanine--D-glutamate ligase [Syntrophomonadaceae bacterium]|nr:UDP-N-acetylmuramoyl-L-alanine--D-glutamate ligase [Syntrophomonadaceae bacterium]